MAEDTETKAEELSESRPTVYVALGGTGMEILLRLRRRILQHSWGKEGIRLSSLSDFPIASFVYFDTDTNDAREAGRAATTDPLANAVRFAQGDSLQKKVDVGHYQREVRNYPQIAEWLPTADLSKIDTSKGAGQVRSISRLLFFDIYSEFTKLVQSKAQRVLANVTNADALDRLGLKSKSQSLRVVLVGSSAGGTGSGSFIDVGYAIKNLQTPKAEQVDMFLLLPGGYTGANRERVFANTYAAMMELEHVTRERRDAPYVEGWTQFDKNTAAKPFDDVYLLDTANLVQERTENVNDLYEMVADVLFEDYGNSEFARRKRSVAVNQQQHKLSAYHPPLPVEFGQNSMAYSRGYSSLGQCTVATKGRIQLDTAIAEAGLGMMEAFFGIANSGQKNVPTAKERDEFLNKHVKLGVSAFEDYPEDLPDRPPAVPEYDLISYLLLRQNKSSIDKALADQIETDFREVVERFTDIKDWPKEIESIRERRKVDVDGKPGTGDLYGPLGREVVDARSRLALHWKADDGEGSLKALLYALLDDHERGGLDYTIDLIEQVKNRIDDQANGAIKRLSEAALEYGKLADFFLNERYTPSVDRLREAAGAFLGGRKTATKIVGQLTEDLQVHLTLRLRAIACLEACAMLRDISSYLGERVGLDDKGKTRWSGLIAEFIAGYDTVSATLDIVRDDVRRLHDARDRPQSGMYFVINDHAGEDIKVPHADMLEWAKDAFESYKGSRKLFSTLRTPEGKIEVLSQLQSISRRKLAHFESQIPSVGNALGMLSANERRGLIGKALARAMPWLDANFDRFRGELKGDQFKVYIAIDNAQDFENNFGSEVFDLMPSGFGIQRPGFVNSGVPGRLIIYCELSGIPLDVITPLRADWRRSYERESSRADSIPLHNHSDWMRFPNPVVPTNVEIERLRSDMNLFLRGVAFGVLKRRANARPHEPYLFEIIARDLEQVGSERTLRKKLFDPNQRRNVEEKCLRIEEKLTPLQLLAAAALFQFMAERSYPPRKETFENDRTVRIGGLIHKVARDLQADFQSRFNASGGIPGSALDADQIRENLYRSVSEWTDVVKDSVKDVDAVEANLDPNDLPEFRAQDKRTVKLERFGDEALRTSAGLGTATPPAPPGGGNVIDVPAAVQFYVAAGGDSKGPFNGLELSAMANRGELTPTSLVYDADRGEHWVEASTVHALAGLFARRPSRPPPPPPVSSAK